MKNSWSRWEKLMLIVGILLLIIVIVLGIVKDPKNMFAYTTSCIEQTEVVQT